jgi:hypothetical protein
MFPHFPPSILVYYIFVLHPSHPYPIFVPFISLSYLSRALSQQLTYLSLCFRLFSPHSDYWSRYLGTRILSPVQER